MSNQKANLTKVEDGSETRGNSHLEGAGMLVVSLRGINFGFWSHLGCSEQNGMKNSRQGLVLGLHAKKNKNIYNFNPPYEKRWRLVHLPISLSARKS